MAKPLWTVAELNQTQDYKSYSIKTYFCLCVWKYHAFNILLVVIHYTCTIISYIMLLVVSKLL